MWLNFLEVALLGGVICLDRVALQVMISRPLVAGTSHRACAFGTIHGTDSRGIHRVVVDRQIAGWVVIYHPTIQSPPYWQRQGQYLLEEIWSLIHAK